MRYSNQPLHDCNLVTAKISTAVTTPPALAHVFMTRMLTRYLLVVACVFDEQRVLRKYCDCCFELML